MIEKKHLWNKDIFLKTEYPVALDSPNHLNPYGGSQQDFTDGTKFAEDLIKNFPEKKTLLDLGTATGTVPCSMRKVWKELPEILILETCDISRPFKIVDSLNEIVKFDFITAWSVIEHIDPKRLQILFENINFHLKETGYGIFKIDFGVNEWHQSIKTKEEWDTLLLKYFGIDREIKEKYNWHYCRPTEDEIKRELELLHTNNDIRKGGDFWWVRKN